MSNVDFQNGLAMGIAMRGKAKSRDGVEMPGGQVLTSILSATAAGKKAVFEVNGVVFPWLPNEINEYPYYWIRKNDTSGYYDLVFANCPWYFNTGAYPSQNVTIPWYRVAIISVDTAVKWDFNKNTSGGFTLDESRTVFWSNHDILNGSADATEIYFKGSEPILQII